MPKYPNRVSFALSTEHYEKLRERVSARAPSENLVARAIVEERLERADEALLDALNLLSAELYKVSEAVKKNTETLETMRGETEGLGKFRADASEDLVQLGQFVDELLERMEKVEERRPVNARRE
jgi:hypothetical protein